MIGKSWKDFVLFLADYYLKSNLKEEVILRESLIAPYKMQAKALSEIGKLIMKGTDDRESSKFYIASLLPLLVLEEDVSERDLIELFTLVVNVVYEYLKDKYREKDERKFSVLEYMRVATIRELRGDTTAFWRLVEKMCKGLGELP